MYLLLLTFLIPCSGHFIYMDSSKQNPGDVLRIQTPFFPASHGVCYIRFWYYMFGSPSMGPLKVCYLVVSQNPLWKKMLICYKGCIHNIFEYECVQPIEDFIIFSIFSYVTFAVFQVFLQNRNGNTTDLFWEMAGSQGMQWNYVNIPLGSAQDFSVIFEATRGDQGNSDIAVDDVSFTPECSTGGNRI